MPLELATGVANGFLSFDLDCYASRLDISASTPVIGGTELTSQSIGYRGMCFTLCHIYLTVSPVSLGRLFLLAKPTCATVFLPQNQGRHPLALFR